MRSVPRATPLGRSSGAFHRFPSSAPSATLGALAACLTAPAQSYNARLHPARAERAASPRSCFDPSVAVNLVSVRLPVAGTTGPRCVEFTQPHVGSALRTDTPGAVLQRPVIVLYLLCFALADTRMATVAGPSDALAAAPPAETKLWDAEKRWSASVLVEGEPAEIYKVEHQPVSTTCYIEAVDGKKFTVSFAREAAAPTDQVVLLRIDGSNVDSMLFRKAKPDEGFFTGARISALEERPFVFAPIPLTDEADEAEVDEAILKDLGTIRLDVRRAKARKGGASSGDVYKDALKQHVCDIAQNVSRVTRATKMTEDRGRR